MIFKNRQEAGELLAQKLNGLQNALVIGLARGGIVTAAAVAKELKVPLDIICIRKLGSPQNPELAIGAIGSGGQTFINQNLIDYLDVPASYLQQEMEQQKALAKQREESYHKVYPEKDVKGKTVILVDDGLATGATMQAAVITMKNKGALKVIVAVPVAAPDSLLGIKKVCDEVIAIDAPPFFQAVGQFYEEFSQVEDEEVISILKSLA